MNLVVSAAALADIVRLCEFLRDKDFSAARRVVSILDEAIRSLSDAPERGRATEVPSVRELMVPFGRSNVGVCAAPMVVTVGMLRFADQTRMGPRHVQACDLHDLGRVGRGGSGVERPLRRDSGGRRCADARRADGEGLRHGARSPAGQSPGVDPASVFVQITALREAGPLAAA